MATATQKPAALKTAAAPAFVEFDRKSLLESLRVLDRVSARSAKRPVLQCCELSIVDDQTAILTATDFDAWLSLTIPVLDCHGLPDALINTRQLMQAVRDASGDRVCIFAADGAVVVCGDRSRSRVETCNDDELPTDSRRGDVFGSACMSAAELAAALKYCTPAADTESSRYALGGVLLQQAGHFLDLVATDGRRLHVVRADAETDGAGFPDPLDASTLGCSIIPKRVAETAARLLAKSTETAHVYRFADFVEIRTETATFSIRLLEGRFPRWRDAIPQRIDPHAYSLPAAAMAKACRAAKGWTTAETRGVDFAADPDGLTLRHANGQAMIEADCERAAEPITLDPRYVLDAAALPKGAEMRVETDGPDGPAIIVSDRFCAVVMPLAKDR